MAKKLPLIIPTLILLASIASPFSTGVYATATNPTSYQWSINDLAAIKQEVEDELDSLCHDDKTCRRETTEEKRWTDDRYELVEGYDHTLFAISAINPSKSTIKVFFNSEITSRFHGGTTSQAVSEDLYLYWFDDGAMDYSQFYQAASRDELDPANKVLVNKASALGSGWLTPNQDVEIAIDDASFFSRTPHMLEYYFKADISDVVGSIKYDDCINSPFYHEGMECRLMYNSWMERAYFPFEPDELTPIAKAKAAALTSIQSDTVAANDASGTEGAATSSETISDDNTSITNDLADSNDSAAIAASGPIVKSPETGTGKNQESAIELPWWMIAILIMGAATLVWLFYPNHQNHKKSSKKS